MGWAYVLRGCDDAFARLQRRDEKCFNKLVRGEIKFSPPLCFATMFLPRGGGEFMEMFPYSIIPNYKHSETQQQYTLKIYHLTLPKYRSKREIKTSKGKQQK